MKKFLMIMLCICAIFFCGCQVSPQYTIEADENGMVTQTVYIPFSVSELVNAGMDGVNALQIGLNIKSTFDNYFVNRYDNFVTRLDVDTGLSEADKIMLMAYSPSREDMVGYAHMFENSTIAGITYELKFKTTMAYYYFNSGLYYEDLLAKLNEDDEIVEHNFLTTSEISTGETIYSQNTEYAEVMTLAQYINRVSVETLKAEGSLSDEQIDQIVPKTFLYRYGTSHRRMHSDADLVRFVNGMYYHEWTVDLQNSNRTITTWFTYANQNEWYGLALGATLLLVLGLSLYCYFSGKNKYKQEEEIIESK